MHKVAAERELFRACEIIFGPDLQVNRDFLEYLQISGIKTAYRKRAMETHPDRLAAYGGISISQDAQLFLAVQEAYENLMAYLKAREKGYRLPFSPQRPGKSAGTADTSPAASRFRHGSATKTADRQRKKEESFTCSRTSWGKERTNASEVKKTRDLRTFWCADSLYSGPIPQRRLLFGHYLYYSGLITWRTVIQALVWQRLERPRLGELGRRYGMLSEEEVLTILRTRLPLQPFGQTAVTLGFLTESQLTSLMFHQKRLQRKFGEFFIEKKILRPEQLHRLIAKFQIHNDSVAGPCSWRRISS